jgi:hypothetical protein
MLSPPSNTARAASATRIIPISRDQPGSAEKSIEITSSRCSSAAPTLVAHRPPVDL